MAPGARMAAETRPGPHFCGHTGSSLPAPERADWCQGMRLVGALIALTSAPWFSRSGLQVWTSS